MTTESNDEDMRVLCRAVAGLALSFVKWEAARRAGDFARLQRFLLKHSRVRQEDWWSECISCHCDIYEGAPHATDCEWIALVEMTKPALPDDPTDWMMQK